MLYVASIYTLLVAIKWTEDLINDLDKLYDYLPIILSDSADVKGRENKNP